MSFQGGQNIFGRITENNVYFLIDTSISMHHQLGFVKNHLIEVLTRRAILSQDTMFNIIQFDENTSRWTESLVKCNTETVNIASRWINNLTCGTSTNTLTALLQALSDPIVEAVYMITVGLPDQRPAVILEKLSSMSRTVPVHCIYLNGTYSDPAVCEFLSSLAEQTHGSFHIAKFSPHLGNVEQVLPIFTDSSKERYKDSDFTQAESKPYLDTNSPIARSYLRSLKPLTSDKLAPVPRGPYNDPTLEVTRRTLDDSKVLDYADALIKARDLAQSAGIRCSSTPLASSVMKGVKVLARIDRDGLYYLGQVKDQGTDESFVIKLESCPGLRKPAPQEVLVSNMIAYKDAYRLNISMGDKVLAPWQQDGRYGPGTVLDGFERRDTQKKDDDDGELLVNFFNGETVSLKHGIAIRIPENRFDRMSLDIQLPESQRKKQRLRSSVIRSDLRPRPAKNVWEDDNRKLQVENEKLKQKISEQIEENNSLIHALDLNITSASKYRDFPVIARATSRDLDTAGYTNHRDSPVIGTATSYDLKSSPIYGRASSHNLLRDYDSGLFSDEESCEWSEDMTANYSETSQTNGVHDRQFDLSVTPRFTLPKEKVLLKSDRDNREAKPWRYTSYSASSKPPRFRETALQKPREAGEKFAERPAHEEYQTVAGVSFPAGTDRKFGEKPKKWHPYRQFGEEKKAKENISAVWERKHLKHSEYQDASGVKFPSATDKKFTRSLDMNWSPDTALRNAERSQNWEDGLGHGDAEKNMRYANKLELMRSNKRRYFKDIEDKVAVEEGKEEKRIEFRRNKMTERNEDMAEAEAEQDRLKTSRMETRRVKKEEILKHEKDRTDKTENWKTERIEAMKEKQVKFAEIEDSHEIKNDSKKARRQAYRRVKEHERREEFHERLRKEWRTEDERAERLRQQSATNREKQNIRQRNADRAKEERLSAKQERFGKYRASILP